MAKIITIPNGAITYPIDIDLHKPTEWKTVYTKQYDTRTRYIIATIWNDGIQYPLTISDTINFCCTKPDGFGIDNEAGIDTNGCIIYEISEQTTAKEGQFPAEFRIYSSYVDGEGTTISQLKSSPSFKMWVEKSTLQNNVIISTNEVNVLTNLITDASTAITDATTATANANTAIDTINATNQTVSDAEVIRVADENTRISNEDERIANENKRWDYFSLTQAEYDALPQVDKDNPMYIYEITDDDGEFPTNLQTLINDVTTAKTNYDSAVTSSSNVEVVEARTSGVTGTTSTTLKGRLDSVDGQLAANTNQIETHTSQISALSNGAPKAVPLVSQMTDTTKNYVYTGSESGYTAGNWYYHNGSSWVSGGTYQAASIGVNSVKAQNIPNNAISSLKISDSDFTNLFSTANATIGKYLDGAGAVQTLGGFAFTDYILVEANTQYCGYFKSNDAQDIIYYLCCYDSSKNYISTIGRNSSNIGILSDYERMFITPSNCAYIRANYYTANISSVYISKNLRKNLKWLNISNDNFAEPIKPHNVKNDFTNLFTISNAITGKYLDGAGNEAALSGFAYTDYILVSSSTKYYGYFKSNDAQMLQYCLCCYDSAKNYISTIQSTSITSVDENYCGYFTTPSNCAYVKMNYHLTNLSNIYLSLTLRKTLDWLNLNQMINKNSKYNYSGYLNKTMSVIGDSITNGYNTTKAYREYMKEKLLLRDVYNYGINGSSVSVGQNSMYSRITSVQSADIIVLLGGTNDFAVFSNPIGELYTVTNNVKTPNLDSATFYGALNIICKYLIDNFTSSEIILCTPLHRETFETQPNEYKSNSIGLYLSDYVNAIINVSKFWGIKLCDLFNKSQLNPNIPNCKSLYFHSSDGLHPNESGHERIANEIIKTLLS